MSNHQPVFASYPSLENVIQEADLPLILHFALETKRHIITLIAGLINLWDASNFAKAKKYACQLLSDVVAEMHNDHPTSLFRLGEKYDALAISANSNVKISVYSDLLKLALSLSWRILGKESDGIIRKVIDIQHSVYNRNPIPVFMKHAADLLWQMDAHSPAAILYKIALKENKQQKQLKVEEVLDAYLCWGLCEIDENSSENARRIYQEAISQYIEPGMSAHVQNKKWTEYAGCIHSNMAYIYGTMANRVRDGSQQQNQLCTEARTHIDKALDFNGEDPHTLCTSATLHYDCGEFEEALAGYERYRSHNLSTEDRLMAIRSCIEIRLEQLYGTSCGNQSSNNIETMQVADTLCNDLQEYARLYKFAKAFSSPNQDTLREMEYARAILLNYDPEANLYPRGIGICLLKIYICAQKIKVSLRYPSASAPACLDNPKNSQKDSRIAYYTSLANAKYLLDRTLPDEQKNDQPTTEDPDEWPDAPKTPSQARNRLTMMHVSYMNDPNEGHTLLHALYHAVEDNKSKNHLFRNTDASVFFRKLLDEKFVFMKSFTRLIDQLNMWTTYASDRSTGSDSNGCCICIAPETFEMMIDTPQESTGNKHLEKNQDDYHLYRIAYLSDGKLDVPGDQNGQAGNIAEIEEHYLKLQDLFRNLNELLDQHGKDINRSLIWNGLSRSLAFIAFLFKDASYSAEKELRLIITRDRDNRRQIKLTDGTPHKLFIMPPHQIFVDQIILGPKLTSQDQWIPYLQYKLADMWESWPASMGEPRTPKVRKSKISYRD